jgi:hypothetical protein
VCARIGYVVGQGDGWHSDLGVDPNFYLVEHSFYTIIYINNVEL